MQIYSRKKHWYAISNSIANMFATQSIAADNFVLPLDVSPQKFNDMLWRELLTEREEQLLEELGPKFSAVVDILTVSVADGSADLSASYIHSKLMQITPPHGSNKHVPRGYAHATTYIKNFKNPIIRSIVAARTVALKRVHDDQTDLTRSTESIFNLSRTLNIFVERFPPGYDMLSLETREELASGNQAKAKRKAGAKAITQEILDEAIRTAIITTIKVKMTS